MKNKCDDFEYAFTLYFRHKIYEKCKVLVNDMAPVISELNVFIKEVLLNTEKEDSCVTYRVLDILDLYVEVKNSTIKRYKWFINTDQLLNNDIIEINYENVNSIFKSETKNFKSKLKEENIIDFPKELLYKTFVCFIETVGYYLEKIEVEEDINIYDIITLSTNGNNNIVY